MEYEFGLKYKVADGADMDELLEVTPDFVGMTEVAEMLDVSRQNIQRLKQAHPFNFPTPVHEGNAAVWHLAHLLEWFKGRASYDIDQALLDVAHTAMQINLAKEAKQMERRVQKEVLDLVA